MDQKKLSKVLVKELEDWIWSSNYSQAKVVELIDRVLKKVQVDTVKEYNDFLFHKLDDKRTRVYLKILDEIKE